MVQKAKLDILENLPDVEIPDTIIMPEAQDGSIPLKEKWALNKLLLIVVPVLIVVLVIGGALWFYLGKDNSNLSRPQIDSHPESNPAATVELAKQNFVYFKDFIIDLKDKSGKGKILLCDVVIDLSEDKVITELASNRDIRSTIYLAAKTKSPIALRSIEERKRLKKEILQEMNKMLGEGIVKNVYFTNYIIM